MFEKIIEFSAHEDYLKNNEDLPEPVKLHIPEWFKKLKHSLQFKTVKGCMPFLDSLTTGYILKMPQDFYIKHNFISEEGKKDSLYKFALSEAGDFFMQKGINVNTKLDTHATEQLKGCPYIEKNKNFPFYKIINPWFIKTPPGYSCLFTAPLNNEDDRFEIISGIVDTDTFPNEINFPIVLNGDKYPTLETVIKKGTPYVQIIPFKRDSWKIKISKKSESDIWSKRISFSSELMGQYKNKWWNKKSWK